MFDAPKDLLLRHVRLCQWGAWDIVAQRKAIMLVRVYCVHGAARF
jgi:hypothetical protein